MKKTDFIAKIIEAKRIRIAERKNLIPEEEIKNRIKESLPARGFKEAISKPSEINLIAEIKKASASKGLLRESFDPVEIAKTYQASGARCVSVLTEEDFFQGNIEHLLKVKENIGLPILRKDFILEPYQVYESRVFGADCILLIVSIINKERLVELLDLARSLGLDCLVEIHNEKELKRILKIKQDFIIGINNRDLETFEVDLKTSEKLLPFIPKGNVIVVESGIKNYQDVLFLKLLRVNAVLIGEAFMRSADIGLTIREVMGW